MRSENIFNNIEMDLFLANLNYFGIAVSSLRLIPLNNDYHDIEEFFLECSHQNHTPRTLEGVLTWLKVYGYLLSPSKLRRMITSNFQKFDSSVVGAYCDFVERFHQVNLGIVKKICQKKIILTSLTRTPVGLIRSFHPSFKKWNLAVTNYECDEGKFLTPTNALLNECIELRNRIIMGSVVNADAISLIMKEGKQSQFTQYEIARRTHHQRSSVRRALNSRFQEIFNKVNLSLT